MATIGSYTCSFILLLLLSNGVIGWSSDQLPYYQRNNDGSYRYGYDAGGGFRARQSATAANEVEGQYSQLLPDGNLVNVRYKAGVGGFRPQLGAGSASGLYGSTVRPYRFSYNTGDVAHHAVGDRLGNVRGKYWYRDHAGEHDLHYAAGPRIGFVPTGGSLAVPNGLAGRRSLTGGPGGFAGPVGRYGSVGSRPDGSYGFGYPNDDASRPVITDANGNVHGGYPHRDNAVNHDLPYGGSLANPNGLHSRSPVVTLSPTPRSLHIAPDGSYSFGYQTPDSARRESADARGNVHGSYAFRNEGGNHDLSFVAGPGIGFRPTGGSLANDLANNHGGGFDPTSRVSAGGIGGGTTHGHPAYATGYPTGGSGVGGHDRSLGVNGLGVSDAARGHDRGTNVGSSRHEALDDGDDGEPKDVQGVSHRRPTGGVSNSGSGGGSTGVGSSGQTGIGGHGSSGLADTGATGGRSAIGSAGIGYGGSRPLGSTGVGTSGHTGIGGHGSSGGRSTIGSAGIGQGGTGHIDGSTGGGALSGTGGGGNLGHAGALGSRVGGGATIGTGQLGFGGHGHPGNTGGLARGGTTTGLGGLGSSGYSSGFGGGSDGQSGHSGSGLGGLGSSGHTGSFGGGAGDHSATGFGGNGHGGAGYAGGFPTGGTSGGFGARLGHTGGLGFGGHGGSGGNTGGFGSGLQTHHGHSGDGRSSHSFGGGAGGTSGSGAARGLSVQPLQASSGQVSGSSSGGSDGSHSMSHGTGSSDGRISGKYSHSSSNGEQTDLQQATGLATSSQMVGESSGTKSSSSSSST